MDINNNQAAPDTAEPAVKKIQVNTDLLGEVADAFERFREDSGVGRNAPALRALLIPRLRELGYLRASDHTNALGAIGLQSSI
jgi:hypothetical protein